MDLAAVDGGFDLDGIGAGVLELVVLAAVIDGRVHAHGHVVHLVEVHIPLDGFQVRVKHRIVDRRCHLADAAAKLRLGLAAGKGDGFHIALLRGPFADDLVEGEGLARQQDRTVDGLAGQLQVVGTGSHGGVGRMGLGQHVPEQGILQEPGRDVRLQLVQTDPNLFALAGLFQLPAKHILVEAVAGLVGDDLVGVFVKGGILRVAAVLLVQGFHVRLLRGGPLIGQLRQEGRFALPPNGTQIGLIQGLEDGIPVDGPAGHAGVDHQVLDVLRLQSAGIVEDLLTLGLLLDFHLGEFGAVLRHRLIHQSLEGLPVHGQIFRQVHRIKVLAGLADAFIQVRLQLRQIQIGLGLAGPEVYNDGLLFFLGILTGFLELQDHILGFQLCRNLPGLGFQLGPADSLGNIFRGALGHDLIGVLAVGFPGIHDLLGHQNAKHQHHHADGGCQNRQQLGGALLRRGVIAAAAGCGLAGLRRLLFHGIGSCGAAACAAFGCRSSVFAGFKFSCAHWVSPFPGSPDPV